MRRTLQTRQFILKRGHHMFYREQQDFSVFCADLSQVTKKYFSPWIETLSKKKATTVRCHEE